MKVTYYTLLLIIFSLSSLCSQGLSLESPIAINESGDNAKPACLLDLSESKKACKISELNQTAINNITDCDGAIVYNSDSLRYEISYSNLEQLTIGTSTFDINNNIVIGSQLSALPYFNPQFSGWVDSFTLYITSCNSQTDIEFEAYVVNTGFDCQNNFTIFHQQKTQIINVNQIISGDWNTFTFATPVPIAPNQTFFVVPLFNSCTGNLSNGAAISQYGNLDFLTGCSENDGLEPAIIYHTFQNVQKWKSLN